ncbi:MAG: tRNA (adenosine(37)-N6)-threonylcarbamoyltransferase complex dimerization subunit type 1 TsaB [Terrimicrobiaceae bacterium]
MILALDASTTRGSVALVSDHEPLREIFIDSPRGRGGALFSALEKIVGEAADIERVIVGVGPGSYNGIRSALAVAWGIATARGIPLVGISSLLGLDEGSYCAVGDARRGQYYFARVSGGRFVVEPELLQKAQLVVLLSQTPDIPILAPAPIEFLQGVVVRTPSAARLARLAADWQPNRPEPLYLKAPHITGPKGGTKCS